MGKFLETEKSRLSTFKLSSPYFSDAARRDGLYKSKLRPFCVPQICSKENLFPGIRETASAYFLQHEIKWHDAIDKKPSNHLCDSQVCCVNFLYPFVDKPAALIELFRPLYPQIKQVLPMEQDGHFVAFEWIGKENYLGERIPRHGKRTRGANFTSTDAAVMFERLDGKKQIVLIEWKYTESYSRTSLTIAKSGTDRTAIYAHLYERDDFPLDKKLLPGFDSLFYEPFYQLMRQQLLAHEMEIAQELGAEIVSLLHISPKANQDFQRVTSPKLAEIGDSVTAIWDKLQLYPTRFKSISVEEMFHSSLFNGFSRLDNWWKYISARYVWLER
ncbi:MAG: hypothetical protein IAF02_27720 [Anaerolineae bacterium]|nr:hypothetical protein [Anaerolineae bacterium]